MTERKSKGSTDSSVNKQRDWNSLEITKIGVGVLTPILIFYFGLVLKWSDEKRIKAQENDKLIELKKAAVQSFSKEIYERRTRAEMLASSIRRYSKIKNRVLFNEILDRKRLYDEVFAKWNTNNQSNLLMIRWVISNSEYSEYESIVTNRLVKQTFKPIDVCLTTAYDSSVQNVNAQAVLDSCKINSLLQRSLDCGYALSDELYRLAGLNIDTIPLSSEVNSRCPDI